MLHRREDYQDDLVEGAYVSHGDEIVEVRDDARYGERFQPFAKLYSELTGDPYPLIAGEQYVLRDYPHLGLLFLGLNSAHDIDHHFRSRAAIHPAAVAEALRHVSNDSELAGRLKIAVWHHPVSGPEEAIIRDQGVLERLARAGFRLVLHGHIHKAETAVYCYDQSPGGRRLDFVAAGTFGAPTRDLVPGYPFQYNLLRISSDQVIVETRRREELNGAWKPDARWLQGQSKDPLPRYVIRYR